MSDPEVEPESSSTPGDAPPPPPPAPAGDAAAAASTVPADAAADAAGAATGAGAAVTAAAADAGTAATAPVNAAPVDAGAPAPPKAKWRSVVGWICLVLGGVLLPLAGLSFWAHNLVFDTDRYVETVAPLADSPEVQNAVVTRGTQAFEQNVDVASLLQEYLPSVLQPLIPAAESAVNAAVEQVLRTAVESQAFETVWKDANRVAHAQVVGAFTGKGDQALAVEDGKVAVDLGTLLQNAISRLEGQFPVLGRIPADKVNAEVVLFQSSDLTKVQNAFDLLDTLGNFLPLLTIALFAAAVLLFHDRRRGLFRMGVTFMIASAVTLIALGIGRQVYLGALPAEVNRGVAQQVWEVVLRFLRSGLWFTFVVGLIIALVAWAAGHGPTRRFIGKYLRYVQAGSAVVWLVLLSLANNMTPLKAFIWFLVLVGVLVALELVGRTERQKAVAAAPAA